MTLVVHKEIESPLPGMYEGGGRLRGFSSQNMRGLSHSLQNSICLLHQVTSFLYWVLAEYFSLLHY